MSCATGAEVTRQRRNTQGSSTTLLCVSTLPCSIPRAHSPAVAVRGLLSHAVSGLQAWGLCQLSRFSPRPLQDQTGYAS